MFSRLAGFAVAMTLSAQAGAAGVTVYDDALQNGFQNWDYNGTPTLNNPNPTRNGSAYSIAFTGNANASNGITFAHPSGTFSAASYTLRFFLDGGVNGGQKLRLMLRTNSGGTNLLNNAFTINASAPVNSWAEVDVPLGSLAFNGNGSSFDTIDLLAESNSEPTLYIDDVALVAGGGTPSANYIFGDSFEPEYMFAPQYSNGSIKVFQRATNTTDFSTPVNTALLPVNSAPNAVSFAPDGNLWVVDDGNHKLQRFTLASVLGSAGPTPTATVTANLYGGLYDLAFFGNNAYVSSDSGILKYSLAELNAGGTPVPATFDFGGGTPVGLAFDTQGHLWICNYGVPGSLMRITAGTVDVTISGNSIDNCEGLAFDEFGSLWIGDNNQPTMYAYGSSQITANGSPIPIGQINMPDPAINPGHTGFVGGVAVDRRGDLRANYENDNAIEGFTATAAPWNGPYTSYTSTTLTALSNATTDPGRGGIAIWPVPHTVHHWP